MLLGFHNNSKMTCFESCFKVDKATYVSVVPVIKSLSLSVCEETLLDHNAFELESGSKRTYEPAKHADKFFLVLIFLICP